MRKDLYFGESLEMLFLEGKFGILAHYFSKLCNGQILQCPCNLSLSLSVYIHTHTHTYLRTHIFIYVCKYVYIYICTHIYVCIVTTPGDLLDFCKFAEFTFLQEVENQFLFLLLMSAFCYDSSIICNEVFSINLQAYC